MAKITISELRPAGADLFDSSQSFMMDLSDDDLEVSGGLTPGIAYGLAAIYYGITIYKELSK